MNAASPSITNQLNAIEDQLSAITEELSYIRKARIEIEDLKNDLQFVVRDVFHTTIEELEEVSPFIKAGDMTQLAKRLIRNVSTFNEMMGQLESARDFIADAQPLGKEVFHDSLILMDEMEKKGYFTYAIELKDVLDRIVEHFTVEDVHALAENIVTILETIKNITQPEMLNAVNNAAVIFQHLDPSNIEEYSVLRIMKEVNSKEMRRAMGLLFTFLKRISAEYDNNQNP